MQVIQQHSAKVFWHFADIVNYTKSILLSNYIIIL